jgi:hypothetical protein
VSSADRVRPRINEKFGFVSSDEGALPGQVDKAGMRASSPLAVGLPEEGFLGQGHHSGQAIAQPVAVSNHRSGLARSGAYFLQQPVPHCRRGNAAKSASAGVLRKATLAPSFILPHND